MGVVPVLPVWTAFLDLRGEGFQNAGRRGRPGERIRDRARFVTSDQRSLCNTPSPSLPACVTPASSGGNVLAVCDS